MRDQSFRRPSIHVRLVVLQRVSLLYGVFMSRFLSIQQAADEVGVNPKTIRRWISDGRLTARRVGPRLIRIERAELDRLMAPVGAR